MDTLINPDKQYMRKAFQLIVEFEFRTNPTAFPNISKKSFINNLLDRLNDPSKIHQGKSSLCGPATVLYCWLIKRPDLFTLYVISVFENGTGKMGELIITPHEKCRNFKPASVTDPNRNIHDQHIIDVDWVALAALRDSENPVSHYGDESDGYAGITLPCTVERWFSNIGFKIVQSNTGKVFFNNNIAYKALLDAIVHFKADRMVCLFICARLFDKKMDPNIFTADHWVVMRSEPQIDYKKISPNDSLEVQLDKPIDFRVYSWGDEYCSINMLRVGCITVRDFLKQFYGFIAVEYDETSLAYAQFSLMQARQSNTVNRNPWRIKGIYN